MIKHPWNVSITWGPILDHLYFFTLIIFSCATHDHFHHLYANDLIRNLSSDICPLLGFVLNNIMWISDLNIKLSLSKMRSFLRIRPTLLKYNVYTMKYIKFCCGYSVAKLCPALCDPMGGSISGFAVLHYLPEFAQTHVHWVNDAI